MFVKCEMTLEVRKVKVKNKSRKLPWRVPHQVARRGEVDVEASFAAGCVQNYSLVAHKDLFGLC